MNPGTKDRLLLYSGISALLVPIISTIFISIAISRAERWFAWQHNWLSDLGVHNGSAMPFNLGLIISGALTILIAVGLFHYFEDNLIFNIGKTTFLIAAISLMLIGIFTEDYSPHHYIVSVMFFSLSLISIIIFGIGHLIENKMIGLWFCLLGVSGGMMWAIPWPGTAGAIPEATSIVFIVAFSITIGVKMITASRTRP